MSLPYNSKIDLTKLDNDDLFNYFSEYTVYINDSPIYKYAIRIDNHILFSNDTYDLLIQFKQEVKKIKTQKDKTKE